MINAIVAIGKVDWEASFVSALAHPMTGLQVQRRCVDAVDVLAVTKVLSCDVVIISDHTMRVDEEFIIELVRQKVRVIAITNNKNYFESLGAVECISLDLNNPLSVISTLAALVRVNKLLPQMQTKPMGELIMICGFGGGTGKTRLSIEIARQLSIEGKKTLLVDADTYGPSILQLLALPVESPGLLDACRKIERNLAEPNLITNQAAIVAENLFVLPGLIKASRWIDLRQSALKTFWDYCLVEFDYVIVDSGPVFEPEPVLSIETGLPKRNLASGTTLAAANKIVFTCRRDQVSVTKLIKGLVEFEKLYTNKPTSVVAVGPANKKNAKEIISTIQVYAGVASVHVIDSDSEITTKAEFENSFISATKKNSDLAQKYQAITKSILETSSAIQANSRLQKLFPRHRKESVA
jgi:cellulose biosynthesis protein BcsQ